MEEHKQITNLNNKDIKVIHTYTSDMADAVRENEASVIKIALAEKAKREREEIYKEASGTPASRIMLIVGGLALIGIAIGAFYFVMKKNEEANTPQVATKDIETIITYNDKAFLYLTETKNQLELSEIIKTEWEKPVKPGSIKAIFLTKVVDKTASLLPLNDFLSLLESSAPQPLIRSLSGEYMLGSYQSLDADSKPHLFMILEIKDYNQSYISMLAWEKSILRDMFLPFNVDISGERSALLEKPWSDVIINNKDARALYDSEDQDILYYIFPDKKTLIITDNQDTIKEISSRLLNKLTKPL